MASKRPQVTCYLCKRTFQKHVEGAAHNRNYYRCADCLGGTPPENPMASQKERFESYRTRVEAGNGLLDWEWDDYTRLERHLHPEAHAAKEVIRREKQAVGDAINRIPENVYWLLGKGRNSPAEPLYGVQLLDPETRIVVAEAEAEKLSDAIAAAVGKLRTTDQADLSQEAAT